MEDKKRTENPLEAAEAQVQELTDEELDGIAGGRLVITSAPGELPKDASGSTGNDLIT